MEIKKGDYVTRNSYNNDIIFKVINIKNNIYYLKGADDRLYADSFVTDLMLADYLRNDDFAPKDEIFIKEDRDDFFYLPAKILHIDGDKEYLNRCLEYYNNKGVLAIGKALKESEMPLKIMDLYMSFLSLFLKTYN